MADRTAELTIEAEIKALVQSAAAGDLIQRMATDGKSGVFAEIGKGINQLIDNMSEVVSRVQAAAVEVSRARRRSPRGTPISASAPRNRRRVSRRPRRPWRR